MLGQQLGFLLTAWASFNRIEAFLVMPERVAPEVVSTDISIRFDWASFGRTGDNPIIRDINLAMPAPKLWMITGRVGCVSGVWTELISGEIHALTVPHF